VTLLTEENHETAIMVGVRIGHETHVGLTLDESMLELEMLAETAGNDVLGSLTQNLARPNSRTYIGKGKVEELKLLAEELDVDTILFDDELSPRHQRELESEFTQDVKILDRTALILDIFAQHADTREGMLQVELAQYKYRLPRLTRAWTHLARQSGGATGRSGSVGGVGLRGPGEMQLEVDRREINKKIDKLEEDLEKVRQHRERYRRQRRKTNIPVVALVGYTNAGKSTLLNALTESELYVAAQLFATLDPTTRQFELPTGETVLLTDTVGFIQKLPTDLVAAFRATLEEITEANLLLHVIDGSHENADSQRRTVLETLEEIGAGEIPLLNVYNKIDLLDDESLRELKESADPLALFISAKERIGFEQLTAAISTGVNQGFERVVVLLPHDAGRLVSMFHEKGHVETLEHVEAGVRITGLLPVALFSFFEDYIE
jgi:GTP-binding protein HflX